MIAISIAVALMAAALIISLIALRGDRAEGAAARLRAAEASTRAEIAERALSLKDAQMTEALARQKAADEALLAARMADADRRLAEARAAAERQIAELRESFDARLRQEREAVGDRFKALAAEVLAASSATIDERSRTTIEAVLAPVRTSLDTFTKDFREAYTAENTERLSLRENLRALADLNRQVSDEARRLTQALHGNTRWQGRWGEMVLQNILEASGLEEGRCLVLQKGVRDDEGEQLRPDAVINCPDDRHIIIDSKVSLVDYLRYTQSLDEAARAEALKAHVRAIDAHVTELRNKQYQTRLGVGATDFVLMFVPHEGAYLAAVEHMPDLWTRAFDSRVIIVSPTHLVTVVKLVEQMWHNTDRNANADRIAHEAGLLLNKLNGFLESMDNMGRALDKARADYDSALSKLSTGRGSVLSKADLMRRLGAKVSKAMPERFQKDLPEGEEE